jgi:hypothetical protein
MIATVGPTVKVKSPTAVIIVEVGTAVVTALLCCNCEKVIVPLGAMISDGCTVNVAPFASTVVESDVGIGTVWLPMITLEGRTTTRTLSIVVVTGETGIWPAGDGVAKGELIMEAIMFPIPVVVAGTMTNGPVVGPTLLRDGKFVWSACDAGEEVGSAGAAGTLLPLFTAVGELSFPFDSPAVLLSPLLPPPAAGGLFPPPLTVVGGGVAGG